MQKNIFESEMVMMNKYDVIEYFGLNANKKEYKSDEKLELVDASGYKYYLSALNLNCLIRRSGSPNKFFGGNPFTKHNIDNYMKTELNGYVEIVDFMDAKNAKDEFLVRCNIHNITYKRYWNIIKNGSICNVCGDEISRSKRRNNIEDIKKIALEKYDIEIISDEYINNILPLEFICNKHKDKGVQRKSWANMITNVHSCIYCASESIIDKNTKTHEQYMSEIDENIISVDILGEYVDCKTNIRVRCKTCNREFFMRPDHIKNGVGCSNCLKSKGEDKICNMLNELNIEYIQQYRFEDCRNIKPLPFDFYIPSINTVIEYDGEQHFIPIDYFGGDKGLEDVRFRDSIKNNYCKGNNIKLIRIPYWDFDNIYEILNKSLGDL